ncbi:MAG: DUF5667 domain-containing protein [Anaerolineales bacterium]
MKHSEDLLDSQLETWFSSLRLISPRSSRATQSGRSAFLAEARSLSTPVSKMGDQRLNWWKDSLSKYFNFKEYSPMYTTIASLVLVLALMFGGTGATVLAAQGSLPNQSLYQVKTFAEDFALRNTFRNTLRLQLELDYADRRVNEMTRLREMDLEVPEPALERLEKHLDQALILAAQSGEGEMIRALDQIRERLQKQIGTLSEVLDHDPLLLRTREMIQSRLSWAELGLEEPYKLRQQAQVRTRFDQEPQFNQGYGPGPGPSFEPEPGEQGFSPGPQDPTPKNEACQNESCDPVGENGFGPGPNAEEDHPQGNPGPGPAPEGGNGPGTGSDANQNPDSGTGGDGASSNPDPQQGDGSNKGNGGKP